MSKSKKKFGYPEYENLLANAYRKLDLLASKYQELQTYFIGYVEFHGEIVEFNDWMKTHIQEMQAQTEKNIEQKEENHVFENK